MKEGMKQKLFFFLKVMIGDLITIPFYHLEYFTIEEIIIVMTNYIIHPFPQFPSIPSHPPVNPSLLTISDSSIIVQFPRPHSSAPNISVSFPMTAGSDEICGSADVTASEALV